jgi:hypothetical protein
MDSQPLMFMPRAQSQYEMDIFADTMQEFSQMQMWRNTFAAQWEEAAQLLLPHFRNTFFYGNFNWPGQKKTDRQIDASGMVALHRFAAICDSLLTPRNMIWQQIASDNNDVMKDRKARLWFETATQELFKYRYKSIANFAAQNQGNYQSLGAFGNGCMFIDKFDSTVFPQRGLRYKALPLGEMFYKENHQGLVDGFIRWFRLDARQADQKWPGQIPARLQSALEQRSPMLFNFLHRVVPRTDYDQDRLDEKGKPWASYYVSIEGQCLLEEGGYNSFPVAISRYDQAPQEVYGRGPAQLVLPALKTLNAEKRMFLRQGHAAADPALLIADDGLINLNRRPGAVNAGGISPEGRPLIGMVPHGEIQVSKEMMEEEKTLINDMFLVTLFQILEKTPQMSATEVIERVNEKGILLAPTVGRQDSEYLGPMAERELDLLAEQRLLPPMPDILREAKGEYKLVSTSPLSRIARSQASAGFMRTLESFKEIINVTQDPSILDVFAMDRAGLGIADQQAVPESWMATPDEQKRKANNRAKQQQVEQQIKAAPAQAAMMKAQAVAAKAGGGQPQGQQPQQGAPQ